MQEQPITIKERQHEDVQERNRIGHAAELAGRTIMARHLRRNLPLLALGCQDGAVAVYSSRAIPLEPSRLASFPCRLATIELRKRDLPARW
jgi:hypothetical protein